MRPVTYYTFPKAPKHYFTEEDIGGEFVRTHGSFNDDLRWVVKRGSLFSSDEEQVRKYAVKLLGIGDIENGSYFKIEVPNIPPRSNRIYKEVSRSDFDDGHWISLEDCLEVLKESHKSFSGRGLVTQVHAYVDDPADYDYEQDKAVTNCSLL